ncbi:MAG: trypsin-like peptidase domain-containing protein [FCB group bacterium]|nr:trypsin-like peptidase domain-containing protein [FCB group bacterium]
MKRALWAVAGIVLLSGCATTRLGMQDAMVIRAKDRVAPALVHIIPVKEVFTAGRREEIAVQGSGFIITPDGIVVTNEHVAGQSRFVKCILQNKQEFDAEVVGIDPDTDVAVLRLKADRKDFPTVKLGTSADLESGQTVLALGSPHGLSRSVSAGIISVTDRYLGSSNPGSDQGSDAAPFNTWIQTDAAINSGNSGGPLVNLRGEVIGINTRKLLGADNVGFAIPIDVAKEIVAQLIEHGKLDRGWIGVSLQEMGRKTDDASARGVVIADVEPLSPADEAGIRAGDVLRSINGQPTDARYVEGLPAIRKAIADLPLGSEAILSVARGEEVAEVKVKTVLKSGADGNEVELPEWGFTVSEVTPLIARQAQLPGKTGVFISGAQVGSVAANARLQSGDIILKVDNIEVDSLETFRKRYDEVVAAKKPLVLLDVKNGALTRFVLVEQEQTEAEAEAPEQDSLETPEGAVDHVE